jgi:hypothetical protein
MENFHSTFSFFKPVFVFFLLITSFTSQGQINLVAATKIFEADIALEIIFFLLPSTRLCNGKGGIANMKSVVYVQDVYGKG